MNIAIEAVGLISAIVGIFRLDKPEKLEKELNEEVKAQDDDDES